MINTNNEMEAAASYAVKIARDRFGKELSFTEQGVAVLEDLLAQAYRSFSSRTKDKKTSIAIFQTASIWGSFLGEYIRLRWGGEWIVRDSERYLVINNTFAKNS